jgi:zinc transport system substrate-binding protein
MKKIWITIIILLILGFFLLYNNLNNQNTIQNDKPTNGKLQVTASFYPLYFFAKEIGADLADVTNITPSGSEPHDYEPSARDIALIQNSDLIIINGAGLEPWYEKLKNELQQKKILVIEAVNGIRLINGHDPEHNDEDQDKAASERPGDENQLGDPHIWLSPVLAKKIVNQITQGYIRIDEANAAIYKSNQARLLNNLDQLDTKYRQTLASCKSRDIITSHTAFAYLAREYGLNQISISGLSPNEEPSAQQLADIVNFAKKNNVKYIFFESLVSPKLSETIASEIGAKTLVLDPIEGLSDDNIRQGKNYFTIMEDNLQNLRIALSCSE